MSSTNNDNNNTENNNTSTNSSNTEQPQQQQNSSGAHLPSTEKVEEILDQIKNKTVEAYKVASEKTEDLYKVAAEKTEEAYHYLTSEEAKQKLQQTMQTTTSTLSSAYAWFSSNVSSLVGEAYEHVGSALTGNHPSSQEAPKEESTTSNEEKK